MDHKDTLNAVFLLGGHDLEMQEIRHLLVCNHVSFVDKNLDWASARLSAYADIISSNPETDFYGIELQEDCPLPKHYIRIDHHNDYSDRPASILQVANLLGVEPVRHLRLVAANDAGYIPAMQDIGATDAEIIDIRRRDRAAQGVTEEDERLAEKSIAENLTVDGELLIVHSLTSRFSPICDRLYPYRRLFIYTETGWVFFGEGKKELVTLLAEDVAKRKIYHGGGAEGYIGAVKGAYSERQIHHFVNIIQQLYERN